MDIFTKFRPDLSLSVYQRKSNIMRRTVLLSITAICLATALQGASAQTIETDPIVGAMREELKFNMDQLSGKPVPAYFMSLRMNDTYSATVSSNFGVSISNESHSRQISPQVRVGSPELDNFKYESQSRNGYYGGNGMSQAIPFTDNAIMAVRQGIWNETMKRYDMALSNYNDAVSRMKTNADNEDKAPCFSDAPAEMYYEPAYPQQAYSFDMKYWEERMDRISATFKECPNLEQGVASIDYTVERIYIVNTDGSVVVQNRKAVRLILQGIIRATDGMSCPLYKDWFSYSLDGFPDDETLIAEVRDLNRRLTALRDAPIADPYAGPAIMSGSASGVFFHEIFGHRLEAHRMKSGGQTFKKLVGEAVLPESFQVYDDPTLDYYAGTSLYGHYLYDDEAAKAQRVQCVENGVLKNFLLDRTPIDGFPASNGHGRAFAGYDPVSRQANLIIETSKPYSDEQLREMLIQAIKSEGKEYGYYFRTATSGLTYLGDGGSINSFGVDPVEVYRVFADGRPDQLVRGVTLIGTPLAMFSGIAAGGESPAVFTGQCGAESGWVPVTAISPTIFITKVETQRSETGYELPQIMERPESRNVTGSDSEVIFKAMADEMGRTMSGLRMDGQEPPFYTDFRADVSRSLLVNATLGGLSSSDYSPCRLTGYMNIQLGDTMVTNGAMPVGMNMGDRVEYDCIRRTYWYLSDLLYKNAIHNYSSKIIALKTNPKPEKEASLPEFLPLSGGEFISEPVSGNEIRRSEIEELVQRLSAIYLDYPSLYNTSVSIDISYTDVYRLNSKGLKMRIPYTSVSLSTLSSVRTVTGAEISETYSIPFDCNDYDEEVLSASLREFADAMICKSEAETTDEFYIGPILLGRQAVAYSFNTIIDKYGIASTTWNPNSGRYAYSIGTQGDVNGSLLLGKRFLDPKLGIHLYSDMEEYNGVKLGGSYQYDYDGITPPKDFVLVEDGILRQLMCGRKPGVGAAAPTGHTMVNGFDSQVRMSIMHVTCKKPVPEAKMKAKLIAEAKKAGLDHTYMLQNISYNCYILTRIDVKTGQETVIHSDTPNFERRELMHVIAASKEESIQSYPNDPENFPTMIAPDKMLLESVEMNLRKPSIAQEFQLKNPALR